MSSLVDGALQTSTGRVQKIRKSVRGEHTRREIERDKARSRERVQQLADGSRAVAERLRSRNGPYVLSRYRVISDDGPVNEYPWHGLC